MILHATTFVKAEIPSPGASPVFLLLYIIYVCPIILVVYLESIILQTGIQWWISQKHLLRVLEEPDPILFQPNPTHPLPSIPHLFYPNSSSLSPTETLSGQEINQIISIMTPWIWHLISASKLSWPQKPQEWILGLCP